MRVLRSWVLLVVLAIPVGAYASDHKADLFVGPSYLQAKGSTDHLGGWHISGAMTLPKQRKLSFVGDISTHFYGSDGDKDLTQIAFTAGARWTLLSHRMCMPFMQLMVLGAVYQSDGRQLASQGAGAFAFGAGFDVPWIKAKSTRTASGIALPPFLRQGIRFQADYIKPVATDMKRSIRVSVGWIIRFPSPLE